ncbi:MAG: carbohydrate ABC transporter permease [Fimbriimonadaceae bacterium]
MAGRDIRRTGFVLACLVPGLLLYAGLVIVPFVRTVQLSTFRFSGVSTKMVPNGIENFQKLWDSEQFWWALRNNFAILLVVAPILLALSMVLAHAAVGESRMSRGMRTVYLFPNLISLVAAALIWRAVYHPTVGLLRATGLKGPQDGWLGDLNTAFPSFAVAFIWVSMGFYTMLFCAGLAGIPAEVHEACELEGAKGWRKYFWITRPLMWPVRRVAAVHVTIASLGVFALVNVMTDGAPSNRTETMLNTLYRMMTIEGSFGKAAAMGVVMMCVTAVSSTVLWVLFKNNPLESRR